MIAMRQVLLVVFFFPLLAGEESLRMFSTQEGFLGPPESESRKRATAPSE
jgi:hypothetical protein